MTVSLFDLRPVDPSVAPIPPSPLLPAPVATSTSTPAPAPAPASVAPALLQPLVVRVQKRRSRIAGRELLVEKAGWAIGIGALLGASRPLFWHVGDAAPLWIGFARALALTAAGSALTALGLVIAGRRSRRPTALGAARAIDDAQNLHEVVASGYAFEGDAARAHDPVLLLARRRAADAVVGFDPDAAFPLPSLRPTRRSLRRITRFSLAISLALCIGAYDRVLVGALLAPPTEDETAAAADLEAAAADLEARLAPSAAAAASPDKPPMQREKNSDNSPAPGEKLADKAREAIHAARRGDREGALSKLDDLRQSGRQQTSRARGLNAALRKIADALDPPKGGASKGGASRPAPPTPKAADALKLLADKMRSPEGNSAERKEQEERILDRLERAQEEAKRAAGEGSGKQRAEDQAASDAARAMNRAAEALRRGDREAAARALDEAGKRAEAMEQARAEAAAEAAAIAEMLEKSGVLEEAIQLALMGKEGKGDGDGKGDGKGNGGDKGEGQQAGKDGKSGKGEGKGMGGLKHALAARLAALGLLDSKASGGVDGGGPASERRRKPGAPIEPKGSIRAPSQVTEGERAIQAIRGLGKGSEPPSSYREVFPSYDAAVEEGIQDERIPPARKAAVRRYFESIRPDQAGQ